MIYLRKFLMSKNIFWAFTPPICSFYPDDMVFYSTGLNL